MTKKKKKLTLLEKILFSSLAVVIVFGISFVSASGTSWGDRLLDRTADVLGNGLLGKFIGTVDMGTPEETLGGSGGTFQTDWYKVGNRVTWIKSGQFKDASLVLLSVPNPATGGTATSTHDTDYNDDVHMTATSSVMNLNLDITGVSTSSGMIICGGAADSTSAPTYELFNLTLATSTLGVYNNNQATTTDGLGAVGTGSATQILLTHEYNHFNCVVSNVGDAADTTGFTGGANTFDGYWSLEIMKNLQ